MPEEDDLPEYMLWVLHAFKIPVHILFCILRHRNSLKQGDVLSPMLFNFALEYAIRRVQVNQDALKLNGTHQLLAYADDVNILGGSIHTVKKNAETLLADGREIGLEVSADKTK